MDRLAWIFSLLVWVLGGQLSLAQGLEIFFVFYITSGKIIMGVKTYPL
jgi:hypothetical protein